MIQEVGTGYYESGVLFLLLFIVLLGHTVWSFWQMSQPMSWEHAEDCDCSIHGEF